jgi:transcriptional regulator with XRE-family HTH domain
MRISFGEKLRLSREECGKTLAELADVLECSVPYLCDVERGKRKPFPDRARIALAEEELGLGPGVLFELAAGERSRLDVSDLTPGERRQVARFARDLRAARVA